jgi:ABC-type multidrug transport system fused ATPase/permease subunit
VLVPAGQVLARIGNAQKALAAVERIYAFLDAAPRVPEAPGARMPRELAGAVTFDRVSFAYQPGRTVLDQVSFSARPGELIALVGPSGAGKSTLVSLIARFYDPTEGRVLLDGIDLRALPLAGLRRQVGIVFQDTFLFATTIRENIAFGRAGASEAEIIAAARAANAWEFIEQLPEGLDTPVGERGVRLSAGQKQRLAIARALLRDPRILILDEPTSALDARSEHLLQTALDNLVRGRTTFVIAHRLATVQRADRVVVLDGGRIVEQGTHTELLQRPGLYRELFELQRRGLARASAGAGSWPATARRRLPAEGWG